jgi:hypothetical protein
VRKYLALTLIQVLILAGCGGGGGNSSIGGGGGGGGGGGEGPQVIATPGPPNVEPMTVDQGPAALNAANKAAVNVAFISVTLCVPTTATCQTVDHVQVDTQSEGLRIVGSVLNANMMLPTVNDAGGNPTDECIVFGDGGAWGSLAVADVEFPSSQKKLSAVNVHLIGGNEANRPTCGSVNEDTVVSFGANGIIGVGPFPDDCGGCTAAQEQYYGCPTPSTCVAETPLTAQLVLNPVTLFTTDNNGVIVELPAVGASGASLASSSGSLVFGIGTESNNALATGVTVLTADPNSGNVSTSYNGNSYPNSYLDSGSNGIFFTDTTITQCGASQLNFYCPGATVTYTGTVASADGGTGSTSADFSIANAMTLFDNNPSFSAFSNLGGTNGGDTTSVALGLSFFYGKNVYTAIEGFTAAGTAGPYYAF